MTYTFKLSRRLAVSNLSAMIPPLLILCACMGEEPTAPAAIDMARGGIKGSPFVDITITPSVDTLKPSERRIFLAKGVRGNGDTVTVSVNWQATGGLINPLGEYSAGPTPGLYRIIATQKDGRLADTSNVVISDTLTGSEPPPHTPSTLILAPASVSLAPGSTQQFAAVYGDDSMASPEVAYSATGGTITSGGHYTAGQTAGTFRVIATDTATELADTSTVTITAPTASLQAVMLAPANASLAPRGTQQFTATGRMTDGSVVPVPVSYSATGGTISSTGVYTAGSTAGSFRVIATHSSGLVDTATITITEAMAGVGTTFFLANAESGSIVPPWPSWGVHTGPGGVTPANTTARVKNGSRAWKFEVTDPDANRYTNSAFSTNTPQVSMGCQSGHYCTGWYSAWMYIDAGYTIPTWNATINFLATDQGGSGTDPIGHIGLEISDGVLQLNWYAKNCADGHKYTCPTLPGYAFHHGSYWMTASSPAGVVPFPRNQWVHVAIYYKMASLPNGEIQIWQDGVMIERLTNLDTKNGFIAFDNQKGDLFFSFGMYQGAVAEPVRRIYMDDIKVTNYRPSPTNP